MCYPDPTNIELLHFYDFDFLLLHLFHIVTTPLNCLVGYWEQGLANIVDCQGILQLEGHVTVL